MEVEVAGDEIARRIIEHGALGIIELGDKDQQHIIALDLKWLGHIGGRVGRRDDSPRGT